MIHLLLPEGDKSTCFFFSIHTLTVCTVLETEQEKKIWFYSLTVDI